MAQCEVSGEDSWPSLNEDELKAALLHANETDTVLLDAFFEALCGELYDVEQVLQETDMQSRLEDDDPMAAIATQTKAFYEGLLSPMNKCDGIAAQRKTPLQSVAVKEIASACARVSLKNGLPGDGHVVHSLFQGQAAFQNAGRQGCVRVEAVKGTESDWNVAGSKLPVIVEGDSSAGKGNAKHILLNWLKCVGQSDAPSSCTNVLKQ